MTASIGVNLLWLVPGVVGGSEEYTLRLLRALAADGHDDLRLRLYGQQDLFAAHPDLVEHFDVAVAPNGRSSKLGRISLEHSWLAVAGRNDDLMHHGGGVVPLVRAQPTLVTIHDLQPLDMPEHFSNLKRAWLQTMIPRAVLAARMVLCPSRFTAERLRDRFGVSADRLAVVPQGLDPIDVGVLDPEADAALRSDFGRYLLLPAIAYPHKRHADLVRALGVLRPRYADLTVVFTGRPGSETPAIDRLTAKLGLGDRVHHLGRVSEARLDALYRSAAALVFPSAYEGFGNPVLEAMARGCPVITSDATALPEIAGGAALTVPVGNVAALADAIARLLDEPSLRRKLITDGVARAADFSAAAAGEQLAACYRQALRSSR